MTFAIRLRQLMDSRGLSRYKLAQKVGIDRSTIGRYLDGKTEKPTKENLHQLATYFNISISDLIQGEDSQPGNSDDLTNQIEMIDKLEIQNLKTQLDSLRKLVIRMDNDIHELKEQAEKKTRSVG